jgi:acyl carrier protein
MSADAGSMQVPVGGDETGTPIGLRGRLEQGKTTSMDATKAIKKFVLENYLFTDDDSALANGDSLIRKGIVDSTGMLELISHLEDTYGIKVERRDDPANFDSSTIGPVANKRAP